MITPVVYVGGAGRSGSTLLERLLARAPGSCPVGELVFIWERGVKRNDRCGCGDRFHDCAFWTEVGEVAFGGWTEVDVDEAVRLRASLDRHRNFVRLAGLRSRGHLAPAIAAYGDITNRLYAAVSEVSGASMIVDSSKHVGYASLLRDLPAVDLRLVHLVRRSHGVVYSWSKRVRKPDVGDGSTFMSTHSSSWAVRLWIAENIAYEVLRRQMSMATYLRYEDLVADPAGELGRISRELQLFSADTAVSFLGEPAVGLLPTHALSGNPMRFEASELTVRNDEEWRTSMAPLQRAAISAATWPLLKRYHYRLASGLGAAG